VIEVRNALLSYRIGHFPTRASTAGASDPAVSTETNRIGNRVLDFCQVIKDASWTLFLWICSTFDRCGSYNDLQLPLFSLQIFR